MARLGDGGELLKCSFCGKSQKQVKKLIAGPGVYICDECIDLCNEIIEEEFSSTSEEISFSELPKPAEIRDFLLKGGSGKKMAIFIGALTRNRGLEQLIESAQYLREAEVVIVGDGLLRRSLEEKVREMRLGDRVRFAGWIPQRDLLAYVASADVGVEPTQDNCLSYRYALGNKTFEYLMAGLPVAVSDQPHRRQIVERYGVGEVFDEKDPRSIAQAIDSIVSDEERYREMRHRARLAAREEFNWEVQAKKLVEAYEKLFSKSVK